MRITLASAHGADLTYAGAERYVHDLASGLATRGEEVSLLSAFPIRDDSAARTVVLHPTDWRDDRRRRLANHAGDWLALPSSALSACLAELAPELLHTSNLPGFSTAIWEAARRQHIPVVHTLHDYHLLCPRTTLVRRDGRACRPSPHLCGLRSRRLGRWAGSVAVVIGVSSHVLARHADFFPASTERVVIRAPALPPSVHLAAPQRPPRTIGYIGRLAAVKGASLLLEAGPELAALGVTLRVAGNGELAEALGASPHVDFAGQLAGDELVAFIASCDIGVVPSLWEEPGLTYALREWLAYGRPVLTTRRGALAEALVLGGVEAFEPSAAGLVRAAAGLLDGERFEALVAQAGDQAHDEPAWWLERHLSAYEHALRAGRR